MDVNKNKISAKKTYFIVKCMFKVSIHQRVSDNCRHVTTFSEHRAGETSDSCKETL